MTSWSLPSMLGLWKSCVCSCSCCELMSAIALSCIEILFYCRHPLPLALTVFVPLLQQWYLNVGGKKCLSCLSIAVIKCHDCLYIINTHVHTHSQSRIKLIERRVYLAFFTVPEDHHDLEHSSRQAGIVLEQHLRGRIYFTNWRQKEGAQWELS